MYVMFDRNENVVREDADIGSDAVTLGTSRYTSVVAARPTRLELGSARANDLAECTLEHLLLLGQSLLGYPRIPNCRLDEKHAYIELPREYISSVGILRQLEGNARKNLQHILSMQGRLALDKIVHDCNAFEDSGKISEEALRSNFRDLWRNKPEWDAGLLVAEQLIYHGIGTNMALYEQYPRSSMWHSLERMAEPDFADRLAEQFLFSRLARLLYASDKDISAVTRHLHRALCDTPNLDAANHLLTEFARDPAALLEQDKTSKAGTLAKLGSIFDPLAFRRTTQRIQLANVRGHFDMQALAPFIAQDHAMIRTGAWAKEAASRLQAHFDQRYPKQNTPDLNNI